MTCIVCEKAQGSCEFCAATPTTLGHHYRLGLGDPGDECQCDSCRLRLAGAAMDNVTRDLWPLFANDDLRQLIQDACIELERRGEL